MNEQTIFEYIKNNINEKGVFSADFLPDDPFPTVPRMMGAEDALFFIEDMPPDIDRAAAVLLQLKHLLQQPSAKEYNDIYKMLCQISVASIAEQVAQGMSGEFECEELLAYARSLFYKASNRGPFKFAVLLFGVCGMEKIRDADAQLWHDLLLAMRCEEFTYYFFYGCSLDEFYAPREFWELAELTKGWGRIAALGALRCENEEQRLWLLKNCLAVDREVEYPNIVIKVFHEADVGDFLRRKSIDVELYLHLAEIIHCVTLLFVQTFRAEEEEPEMIMDIDLYSVICDLLRHASLLADTPERIFRIVGIADSLRMMIEESVYYMFTANQAHELLAKCEAIIYARDWREDVLARLITEKGVNEELCYFSSAMGYNVWEKVFQYWCVHPKDITALRYLLSVDDEQYVRAAIEAVDANIKLFADTQRELVLLLQHLRGYPGMGYRIIIAGLNSMYDWPRGVACSILEDWGVEMITPPVRRALVDALSLSRNRVVTGRINALLNGEVFSIRELINEGNN